MNKNKKQEMIEKVKQKTKSYSDKKLQDYINRGTKKLFKDIQNNNSNTKK